MRLNRKIKFDNSNYKSIYANRFDAERRWLHAAACQRSDNIENMLTNNSLQPSSILDLGCGTGEVIKELQSRKIGSRFTALDYSQMAIDHLRKSSNGITAEVVDISADHFTFSGFFDVILLIHVLQHTESPSNLIKNIVNNIKFSSIIIEVPLEDLLLNKIISKIGLHDKNPTGTLHFFNKESLHEIIVGNDLKIIDSKISSPTMTMETLKILRERYNLSKLQYAKKFLTSFLMPKLLGPVKKSLHYSYYTLLCIRCE